MGRDIQEAGEAYLQAKKKGKWSLAQQLASDEPNELIALSDLVPDIDKYREQKVGVREVDTDKIVGTVYPGRSNSFTRDFMPTMEANTEFAAKWGSLYASFLEMGIRDAIEVYEYMGKYYVLEGNKRVSVLKFTGTPVALVDVKRKIPAYDENNEEIKLYYEYMDFEEKSGISAVDFKILGNAEKFLKFVDEDPWSDITRENIRSFVYRVERILEALRKKPTNYTYGDACVTLFSIFGYDACMEADEPTTKDQILKAWSEISILDNKEGVSILTDQSDLEKKKLLSLSLGSNKLKYIKAAFIYGDDIEVSRYVMVHDKGRQYLEEVFGDRIETVIYNNVLKDCPLDKVQDAIEAAILSAVESGCNIIFTTEGYMAESGLKVALEHPECYILNCSLDHSMSAVRCYQVRMYEIKFLLGALAAQLSETDVIGYEADFPSHSNIASINAFARGAKLINPRAKIEVIWTHTNNYQGTRFDPSRVNIILGSDLINPKNPTQPYGLYINHPDKLDIDSIGLAAISIQWGRFYEEIILSILDGLFNPKAANKAVNYWWGFEEGVVSLIKSRRLPESVRRMSNILTKGLIDGSITPYSGKITKQDGTVVTEHGGLMNLSDILKIDYLEDNVVGDIPTMEELNSKAQMLLGYFEE